MGPIKSINDTTKKIIPSKDSEPDTASKPDSNATSTNKPVACESKELDPITENNVNVLITPVVNVINTAAEGHIIGPSKDRTEDVNANNIPQKGANPSKELDPEPSQDSLSIPKNPDLDLKNEPSNSLRKDSLQSPEPPRIIPNNNAQTSSRNDSFTLEDNGLLEGIPRNRASTVPPNLKFHCSGNSFSESAGGMDLMEAMHGYGINNFGGDEMPNYSYKKISTVDTTKHIDIDASRTKNGSSLLYFFRFIYHPLDHETLATSNESYKSCESETMNKESTSSKRSDSVSSQDSKKSVPQPTLDKEPPPLALASRKQDFNKGWNQNEDKQNFSNLNGEKRGSTASNISAASNWIGNTIATTINTLGSGDSGVTAYLNSRDKVVVTNQDISFPLANEKRNAEFHEVFPDLSQDEQLVEDYSCAWQKDVLLQGRMYISQYAVSFYAKIIWVYKVNFTEICF